MRRGGGGGGSSIPPTPSTPTSPGSGSGTGSSMSAIGTPGRKKEYRLRDQTLELDKVKKENFNLRMIISSLKDSIRNSGSGSTELADLRIEV